jgi:hypothetical protein
VAAELQWSDNRAVDAQDPRHRCRRDGRSWPTMSDNDLYAGIAVFFPYAVNGVVGFASPALSRRLRSPRERIASSFWVH